MRSSTKPKFLSLNPKQLTFCTSTRALQKLLTFTIIKASFSLFPSFVAISPAKTDKLYDLLDKTTRFTIMSQKVSSRCCKPCSVFLFLFFFALHSLTSRFLDNFPSRQISLPFLPPFLLLLLPLHLYIRQQTTKERKRRK